MILPGTMCRLISNPYGWKPTHHTQKPNDDSSPREVAAPEFDGCGYPKYVAALNRFPLPRSAEFTRWPRAKYASVRFLDGGAERRAA